MEQEISSKVYGYARVSTEQQLLTAQINKLQAAGIPKNQIFSEKVTGLSKFETRKAFNKLMAIVKEGDEIVVTKLDRLGRSTLEMYQLITELRAKGIYLRSLEQGISTRGEMGILIIQIITAIAEAERTRILERTEEGRQVAKLNGVKFGRKRKSNYQALITEKEKGLSNKEIAEKFNVSLQYLSYVFKNYNA
ncbi:TPA: recombinase family protein [Haemophilus influenzae]